MGTKFTLADGSSADNRRRVVSSYNVTNGGHVGIVFDYDPRGLAFSGLRFYGRGIPVMSKPVKLDDKKYHHLCVTYDDGHVRFYVDGADVGEAWLPGGAPITLARDLLVGEDAELGSDEQFNGNMDDVLVLGRVLSADEVKAVATKGAEAALGGTGKPAQR